MTPDQAADRQLAALGLRPDEIRYVILSCLIPDHAGGMQLFPKATFVLQFQELQDAWWPDRRYMRYQFNELLPTREFSFLELHGEDLDLFGDGTVEVLASPAHTRGEQALVVRLPRTGTVVLPAGVIPQRANLERTVMTGTPRVAPAVAHGSMARLRRIIERERATVMFHHDAEAWGAVRLAPAYYD
jgi:glyoxylase-like metal-dependent hydrolase (beta-lactamase superfamily II)